MEAALQSAAIATPLRYVRIIEGHEWRAAWTPLKPGPEIVIVPASNQGYGVCAVRPVCHEKRDEFISRHRRILSS